MSTYLETNPPKKTVFKASLELEVRHKFCGLQGTTQNMLPCNQTLPKQCTMSPSRRIRETHRKSQPRSPSLAEPGFRCVAPGAVAGSGVKVLHAGIKRANKLTPREHTHPLPLSAPSLRSVYCAQSATGFNNPRHRALHPPPRPHLGSGPGAAPRGPGAQPRSFAKAPRPQIRLESDPGFSSPQQRPPSHLWLFKEFPNKGEWFCH